MAAAIGHLVPQWTQGYANWRQTYLLDTEDLDFLQVGVDTLLLRNAAVSLAEKFKASTGGKAGAAMSAHALQGRSKAILVDIVGHVAGRRDVGDVLGDDFLTFAQHLHAGFHQREDRNLVRVHGDVPGAEPVWFEPITRQF